MKEGSISLSKTLEDTNLKVAKFFTSTKQQNALIDVQKAASEISGNSLRGKSNEPLKAAINATKDGITFAEALTVRQEATNKLLKVTAESVDIQRKLDNPTARTNVTALTLRQDKLKSQKEELDKIISSTDKAIESQNRLAKGIQGTISRISAVFSAVLFYGSKLLGWVGIAITAFSILQLVLDKFGVSDTFDAFLTKIGKGVANILGFNEATQKTESSVVALNQSIFNMIATTEKLDVSKGGGVKTQSWFARLLGLDPESVRFTEELVNKELQELSSIFRKNELDRQKKSSIYQKQAVDPAIGKGQQNAAKNQLEFLAKKEVDTNTKAINAFKEKYSELDTVGQRVIDTILRTIEKTEELRKQGPDALADLQTAVDETGISFEKLYKSFSLGNNVLKSTNAFLPDFSPNIASYLELNKLRERNSEQARRQLKIAQELNEAEFITIRLLNVVTDLRDDVTTGLASEEALSTKLGAIRNTELELTKQIAFFREKIGSGVNDMENDVYAAQVDILQKRLDVLVQTSKVVRAQAEYQITISQQTEKLKKSFSEEFNAASQITGVLSKQSMFAQSALEIRANELEQLSVVLDNTAEVRKLETDGIKLKGSQIALSREGIIAEQILFGLAVKVSQEQKKIIDDLKKQNTDASNKLRAAQLQKELVVIQNKQKYSELAFDVVEKELGLKQQQLDISQKIEEVTIRTSNLLRKTTLALLAELASGPLGNLFSSEGNRNIEITIAENDLAEFKKINDSQIK